MSLALDFGNSREQALHLEPLVPGAGIEPAWLAPGDFKSPVSTSFTTRAGGKPQATGKTYRLLARTTAEPSELNSSGKRERGCCPSRAPATALARLAGVSPFGR